MSVQVFCWTKTERMLLRRPRPKKKKTEVPRKHSSKKNDLELWHNQLLVLSTRGARVAQDANLLFPQEVDTILCKKQERISLLQWWEPEEQSPG